MMEWFSNKDFDDVWEKFRSCGLPLRLPSGINGTLSRKAGVGKDGF